MNRGVTGSVVKLGLIPEIKPLMDIQMRDTVIRVGGDGMYYLTGSTGTANSRATSTPLFSRTTTAPCTWFTAAA